MKSKKLTHILRASTALVLALLLMLGTVTTGFAAVVEDLAETGALSAGDIFFLDIGKWSESTIKGYEARFYGGSDDDYVTLTNLVGNIYYGEVPSGTYTNMLFIRNNGSTVGPSGDWSNKWNDTGDLTFSNSQNYYKITSWDTYGDGNFGTLYFKLFSDISALNGTNLSYDGNGHMTATYPTQTLSAGTYNFKVYDYYPDGGSNYRGGTGNKTLTIASDGIYDISVSFDLSKIAVTDHSDLTVTATKVSSDVTFDMNGHGTQVATQTVLNGTTATEPSPAPSAVGYTFNGWKLNGSTYSFSTPVTADITLIADWTETAQNVSVTAVTAGHGKTSIDGSTYTAAAKTVTGVGVATKGNAYAQADSGYFFTGWTGTSGITFDTTNNANQYHTQFNASSSGQSVTANFEKEVAMEGMTVYLNASSGLDPAVYYATDVSGANSVEGTHAQQYGTSGVYHTEIPAVPENASYNYNCVRFVIGGNDSGYIPITDVLNNSITYSSGNFSAPGRSTATYSGYGKIYFDNTSTNWNISGSNKLYFVIGDNNSNYSMLQMSKVTNTDQLYYLNGGSWNNYTYFGFALATSAGTADIVEKTTYISYYNLANGNNQDKSFIGFGLGENSDNVSALDFLWIKDTAIDGSGVYAADRSTNEGNYLNRGQKVTVGANGSVSVEYYKATSAGTSGVVSQTGTVSASSNTTFYASRSTTFKFHPTPNEGYDVSTVTYDGVGLSGPDANGDYTFTVVGGTDTAYAIQNISVTFAQNSNPVLNSLTTSPATAGTTGVSIGDSVTLTATNTNQTGNIVYTITKNGTAVTASDYLTIGGSAGDRETAAATNTATFRTETPGTYVVTATMGGSSKSATIVVNEPPAMMLLGLWTGSVGDAWNYNTTLNPDRVMTYMPSGPYAGKYYIELSLPDNRNFYRNETGGNGFKVYDVDHNTWYGLNNRMTNTAENYTFYSSDGNNCELEAIRITGSTDSHTYKFVYDATTHNVSVYFPQVITYNNNESNYGGSSDTTSQLAVTYGAKAKNITPTRAGYSFGGWYTSATTQNDSTKVDFTTAITGAQTYYAKWNVNTANIKIEKTENGVSTVIASKSDDFSGVSALTVSKPAANTDKTYVFRGWVLSGDKSSHVRLYTDAACTAAYAAGSDAATIYVKTDGEAGITEDNVTLTAKYVTQNSVEVNTTDTTAGEYFTGINGSTTNPQDIYYGTNVNVTFNNLSAGFGIDTVAFDTGESVEYVNHGHYISFNMPDHDVHITEITLKPYTCRITVKNADKVDIDGISASGYYSTGADVHSITVKGSDDYYGTSILTDLNVKYVGGSNVTVNSSNTSADLTFDGHTMHIVFADNTVTITGKIGGNVIITPTCTTSYSVNITSKVMSDVSSKYITYNKKSTTSLGEVESVTIADLKVYLKLDSAPVDEAAAEAAGVVWPLETRTDGGDTFYLIEADEDGDFIGKFPENSELLLVTDDLNNKYQFIGWFDGFSSGPNLGAGDIDPAAVNSTVYRFTLTKSSFLYGVATRDIFLGGDGAGSNKGLGSSVSWSNAVSMTYDEANQVYYHETDGLTVNTHYYFKIFDLAATGNNNSSGTTNQAVWYNAAKTISYNGDYGNITIDTAHTLNSNGQCEFHLTDGSNTDSNKVRIYYKPSTNEVYIIPVYNSSYHEIYLSNGRIDGLASKLGLTLSEPTQSITTPGQDGTGNSHLTDGTKWEDRYSYKKFTGTLETVNFQVTINGTDAANALVSGFVVYNMDTGEATTAKATKAGNVYSGSISNVSSNTFICPVYEMTESAASSAGYSKYEVFVNAADIDSNVWGDLVAMYVFGGTGTARDNNGGWPGQLMLPSGKSFSGVIYQKEGAELSGVLFNNYNVEHSFLGKFGKRFNYPDWAQTYDYAEPITLMEHGSENLLSFSLKQNNDGYRGEYYNSDSAKNKSVWQLDVHNTNNTECVPGKAYDYYDEGLDEHQTLFDTYTFEYLTDKDGKNRLNMFGESVGSAPAGYYVICVGDVDYKSDTTPNGKPYAPNSSYNGQYSVEWYIYDANGVFLLHTLSDALYAKAAGSDKPYVADLLMNSGLVSDVSTLSEKSIKISYEAPNTRGSATRFSGQWYANSTNEKVTVYAGVGMMDENGNAIVPENPQSRASYGTSAISYPNDLTGATKSTINGLDWASLKLSDATKGAVTLTAATANSSEFKGWYSYDETKDEYTKVSDSLIFNPSFATDSRYFAMFSAQATYYFTYPGRNGIVTYSVKATTGATAAEMSAGGILDKTTRLAEISGEVSYLNKIHVFNHNVTFTIDTAHMDNSNPYEITIEGSSTDAQYTLTVYSYSDSGVLENTKTISNKIWSSKIDLGVGYVANKPSGQSSDVFVGWIAYNDNSAAPTILSTQANFGYSITQNMSIKPFFAPADQVATLRGTGWQAGIDKNVVTQELTDASNGKIYNDTLVNFRNKADTGSEFDPKTNECGIVILFQNKSATSADQSAFSSLADSKVQDLVGTMSSRDLTSAKLGNTNYGCGTNTTYAYRVRAASLSKLNRTDLWMSCDYAQFSECSYKVIAYTKISGEYTYSDIKTGTFTPGQYFPAV